MMQIEVGDVFLNTVLMIILVGWGFGRVIEVWLNVIEKVKKLWKRKEREQNNDKWLCDCGGFIPKRNPETCGSCGKVREQ